LIFFSPFGETWALSSKDLVTLKEAGFSDGVIQAVVREKVIETAAFTVEELVQLKKAGMTDGTIEVLVTERSFMRRSQPIIYGSAVKPLNMASIPDLIELKQSGMSDDVIRAVVIAASERRGEEYDRAWDLLNRMGLEIRVRP
jgi:hypothetical protein